MTQYNVIYRTEGKEGKRGGVINQAMCRPVEVKPVRHGRKDQNYPEALAVRQLDRRRNPNYESDYPPEQRSARPGWPGLH